MTRGPGDDTSDSPGPRPESTPALEPGGGVNPGDTPPASDSMSGATGGERHSTPNMGPVKGNRTPMIITLVVLALIVLSVLGYGIAEIYAYATRDPLPDSTDSLRGPALLLGLLPR